MMVGKWIRLHYGLRSAVTAVFMIHAVLNTNPMVRIAFHYQPSVPDPFTYRLCNLTSRMINPSRPHIAFRSHLSISSY